MKSIIYYRIEYIIKLETTTTATEVHCIHLQPLLLKSQSNVSINMHKMTILNKNHKTGSYLV